jgi:hypothetical protein
VNDGLAALADIELPAPPDWRPLIVLAAAALAIVIAALVVYARRRRAPTVTPFANDQEETGPRAALLRLEHLQREWSAGAIDARAAAYRLVTLLRLGLALPQLHPAAPPAGLAEDEWRETLRLLQDLRYRPAAEHALTGAVFARAHDWLRRRVSPNESGDESGDKSVSESRHV